MINLFGILLSGGEDIYNDPSETNWHNVSIFIFICLFVYLLFSSGNNNNKPKAT